MRSSSQEPLTEAWSSRTWVMIRRSRRAIALTIGLVGAVLVPVLVELGLSTMAAIVFGIFGLLAASLSAMDRSVAVFRALAHGVNGLTLGAVAYGVFVADLPSVIAVYFPAIVLLASSQILGARAALFWSVPSLGLLAAATFLHPIAGREVTPAVAFVIRAATLLTILGFAVSFRRAHDGQAAELLRSASTDELTGVANRRDLDRVLEEALGRAARFGRQGAILFLDLDRMKEVNDNHGHAAGDEFIRIAARRIQDHTRRVDTTARLGGDEFVVVLSEIEDPKGGEIAARKLLAVLSQPCVVAGHRFDPSASVGVVLFPDASDEARELLHLADEAMYEAKRAGGGHICLRDSRGFRQIA